MSSIIPLLDGALIVACTVAGALCLNHWRKRRDRFFVFFAIAFWAFALNWAALAIMQGFR